MRVQSELSSLLMTDLFFFPNQTMWSEYMASQSHNWARVVLPRKHKVQSKHKLIWLPSKMLSHRTRQVVVIMKLCVNDHEFHSLIVYPEFQIYLGFCSEKEVRIFCFRERLGELTVPCTHWEQGQQCLSEERWGTTASWKVESHAADGKRGRIILTSHNDSYRMLLL